MTPILSLLISLWKHLSSQRILQLYLLFFLMVLTSFAEIFSIGAVFPFLGVLTNPQRIYDLPVMQPLIHLLGLTNSSQLFLLVTIGFGVVALLAGGMRLLLLWSTLRLSYAIGSELSISIYRRCLYQPYVVQISRNSSEIINAISRKTEIIINCITAFLMLLTSVIILTAVILVLLASDPVASVLVLGIFGSIYWLIIRLARNRQILNSQLVARESSQVIKSLQEGLGGVRDILIDGTQELYCNIYRNADVTLRNAQGNNQFISNAPRFFMEALGMVLIAGLAFAFAQNQDGQIILAIPILGLFALGAQRMLPILQQGYQSWSIIQGSRASLEDALKLLEQPLHSSFLEYHAESMTFERELSIHGVCFKYAAHKAWVLKDINLKISKGSMVGFIGKTGSGKSTLLDIVMGLLSPTEGFLAVDGVVVTTTNCRGLQDHIAHVPQAIFLADSTILENIAFGVPYEKIDFHKVKKSAEQAQLSQVIEEWPDKYQTFVGERGIFLSGGQRQRIGIARALYKDADILVFDEATSSLDFGTEQSVMRAIEGLSKDLTILIIAHRLSTLKNCTKLVELRDGGIRRVGKYQDFIDTELTGV